jgi:hypothetical protein
MDADEHRFGRKEPFTRQVSVVPFVTRSYLCSSVVSTVFRMKDRIMLHLSGTFLGALCVNLGVLCVLKSNAEKKAFAKRGRGSLIAALPRWVLRASAGELPGSKSGGKCAIFQPCGTD